MNRPLQEHTILVAFEVEESHRAEAHRRVMRWLNASKEMQGPVGAWWVAEDDAIDGSDNDSAIFVTPGAQAQASQALAMDGLTSEWNVVPQDRSAVGRSPEDL